MDYFNRKYIFQPLIFRGDVSFPGSVPFFNKFLHPKWWSPDFWTINSRAWIMLTFYGSIPLKHWSRMNFGGFIQMNPLPSMGRTVYLPIWMVESYGINVGKYTSPMDGFLEWVDFCGWFEKKTAHLKKKGGFIWFGLMLSTHLKNMSQSNWIISQGRG